MFEGDSFDESACIRDQGMQCAISRECYTENIMIGGTGIRHHLLDQRECQSVRDATAGRLKTWLSYSIWIMIIK